MKGKIVRMKQINVWAWMDYLIPITDNCTDTSKKSIVVYENKDKGAEQLICRKRCFYEPVVVKPGYVFGFEAKSYDSGKGVIFAERLNQEIGLCVSTISTANFEENSYVQFTCDDTTNATLLLKATVCKCLSPSIMRYCLIIMFFYLSTRFNLFRSYSLYNINSTQKWFDQ